MQLLPEVSRIGQARSIADPVIAGLYLQAQFLALRGRLQEAICASQQRFAMEELEEYLDGKDRLIKTMETKVLE